ncbi:MAG: precorrin-6y C5,15-methyltransferase (decarboxylating) subunit CbiE [Eubacterium sp.]|nr:precorrin-6y C5,15-methyltransferase (decarboxylating) subunit CbiE [Eubacterium sp.]
MKEIALIGIGPGNTEHMTSGALEFVQRADLVIGASRMLEAVAVFIGSSCRVIPEYRAAEIRRILDAEPDGIRAAVLFSGDTGFYSGAPAVFSSLSDSGMNVTVYPGISSVTMVSARLGISLEDGYMASIHGRSVHPAVLVSQRKKVFLLVGKSTDPAEVCRKLVDYDLSRVLVTVGEELGNPTERITIGQPEAFLGRAFSPLSVMVLENPSAVAVTSPGLPDEAFIRGNVPMTKEEIRTVSVSKLHLNDDSVLWDVGAGTGSISIEAARLAVKGTVCAIEKNKEAVELIAANARKFHTDNVCITEGSAPEILSELPTPTHVFVGGSTGRIREILSVVHAKNPRARVVINAISPETVGRTIDALQDGFAEPEILTITTAKARRAGGIHMMIGGNPIYLIAADGTVSEEPEHPKPAEQ